MGGIENEVFPMTPDQIQEQYKRYNTDPKKVKECEKILEEWYQKQPHLPQKLEFDNLFEKFLTMCCYRMDLSKRKLDHYFSYKGYYNEFYDVFHSTEPALLPSQSPITFVPMPKLGPNLDRYWVGFVEKNNLENMNLIKESATQTAMATFELHLRYEKTNSVTVVADCGEHGSNFYLNKDFLQFAAKFAWFAYHAANVKLQEVHLVHVNSMWHTFIKMLRTFIPQKVMNKVYLHDSYESLYEVVSKEYLPKEFGGTEPSTNTILEKWDTLFMENRKYLSDCGKYVADESKRIGECPHNAMFGVEGCFRKLEID